MTTLDLNLICQRIAVHPPYFAFSELHTEDDGAIRGTVTPEQDAGHERGPAAVAEIGRHLAILGSCAAVSSASSEMTYYLARKGRVTMLRGASERTPDRPFGAVARIVEMDRRILVAEAVAHDQEPFAHLLCEYQIVPASVFSRLFKSHFTGPNAPPAGSPYKIPVPLEFETPNELSIVAKTLPLPASSFAGHFDDYPSWPVAILADTFARVMSRLLHYITDRPVDYIVSRLDVDALKLVPASVSLTFLVRCTSTSKALSRFVFSGQVLWGDTIVSEMESEVFV